MEKEKISIEATKVSINKSLLGAVPYVGTMLNEIFYERRSRIKQERLNNFIAELSEYLNNYSESDFDANHINSESFGDIFESIIKRVLNHKSKSKIDRFKKVLAQQMTESSDFEYVENFLDLIERLNDIQVFILKCHCQFDYDFDEIEYKIMDIKEKLRKEKTNLKKEAQLKAAGKNNNFIRSQNLVNNYNFNLKELDILEGKTKHLREHKHYHISKGEYLFCVQDLISKGLMVDSGLTWSKIPYEVLSITEYGKLFLKFIDDYE